MTGLLLKFSVGGEICYLRENHFLKDQDGILPQKLTLNLKKCPIAVMGLFENVVTVGGKVWFRFDQCS